VFHPQRDASIYFMYGTSANPSGELGSLNADTFELDPEENETYEIGAKKELLDGNLVFSTAIFRTNKKNARVDTGDPTLPPVVLAGEQRVDGFYAGVAGQLTPYWQLFASYTYLDSLYVESPFNPLLEGQALPNAPKNSFSLWTTYDITDRITVGGGAVYQSETPVNNPATGGEPNKVPSFWRFDLMGVYELTERVALQLNVYNLTDELYYDQFYGGHAVPAAGRSALLTTRVKF
jgi:catecholate siderophore receptor